MAQPEARLSRQIMAALRKKGAFVWKNHGSEYTMAGLPDICGVYLGRFIAVETKMPGARLSHRQVYVIDQLEKAGAAVVVAQSVSEALGVLAKAVTPEQGRSALTDALRASIERPASSRRVRGPSHVAELLSGERFIDP